MEFFTKNISRLIFKEKIRQDTGKISMNIQMLNVLTQLDGTKDISTVARSLNMSMVALREVLHKLYDLNLIEVAEKFVPILDEEFFRHLETQLADLMGPIANVLIKDTIKKMGESEADFPSTRASEFLDLLASKIYTEGKREVFIKTMRAKLPYGK